MCNRETNEHKPRETPLGPGKLKLGLCCISEILKKENKDWAFRTMTMKSARSGRSGLLPGIYEHNVEHLQRTVDHCNKKRIAHYRLSSSMFPLVNVPDVGCGLVGLEKMPLCERLKSVGELLNKYKISVSSHPSQFCVLPSLSESTVTNTIEELEMHGWLHDKLGLPKDYSNPINIHIGISSYKKEEIVRNFILAYKRLSNSVKNRLVLENEDKGMWNAETLYECFADKLPLTFDNLHHECNPSEGGEEVWIERFAGTWPKGHTPVFHWSEGIMNGSRTHALKYTYVPSFIGKFSNIVWECEVKGKDEAIVDLL